MPAHAAYAGTFTLRPPTLTPPYVNLGHSVIATLWPISAGVTLYVCADSLFDLGDYFILYTLFFLS